MTAQIIPRSIAEIEVSRSFLTDILDETEKMGFALSIACFEGLELEAEEAMAEAALVASVRGLVVDFALLHESFHILCGHLSELRESVKIYRESRLGMTRNASGQTPYPTEALLRGYYRELEVDNCALQCMCQLPPRDSAWELLDSIDFGEAVESHTFAGLAGIARVVAFRLVTAATWMAVRLMEVNRDGKIRAQSEDHPLPAARLLACLHTVMEEYAELREQTDQHGQRLHQLTEREATALEQYLEHVLKPALNVFPRVDELTFANKEHLNMLDIAQELRCSWFGGSYSSEAGRQFGQLQSLRNEMEATLKPHRYF
ncbi:hypothetical protein [Aeoliella sp.]|uniref:hypothetical protein n=1 Tax=Aeoliella sp. TaxID=2795800 RepID=UPI003CCC18BB